MIHARERERYEDVWASLTQYGDFAPGELWAPAFVEMTAAHAVAYRGLVLDAGTGSGKGALALSALGYDIVLCDITPDGLVPEAQRFPFFEACLWTLRATDFDWVYCCDVLEHIPTEFTMLAVSRLLEASRGGVFLSICFEPDQAGQLLGAPLHLTIQPYTWWLERLADVGEVVESRDLLQSGLFLVRPR